MLADPLAFQELAATAESLEERDKVPLRRYLEAAIADNTRRSYEGQWRIWFSWAESHGHRPLPATPQSVAIYLSFRADEGNSLATLGQNM